MLLCMHMKLHNNLIWSKMMKFNFQVLVTSRTARFHHLFSDENAVPDDPKTTYISRDTEVELGKPARLFCEAFVGR